MARLTAKEVDSVRKPGRYADGDGLYLDVKANGSKAWLFRYQFLGRRTQLGLGGYSKANSLAEARKKAIEMQALLARGDDPKSVRDVRREEIKEAQVAKELVAAAKRNTFEKVALEWWEAKRHEWTNEKHAAQNINTLRTYVFPKIGNKPISEVGVQDVLACLKPIWYEKTETASRLRQRIEQVLNYAKTLGLRVGENPAQLKNNLDHLLPPAKKIKRKKALDDPNGGHFSSMRYQDVPGFVKVLLEQDGLAARMLLFTILTVPRTGPVLQLEWNHLDLKGGVWNVPAKLMKTKVPFRAALSQQAISLLRTLEQVSDYVFPSARDLSKPMSNMAMLTVLRRMGRSDVTVHGFRSSFRTWAEENTDYGIVKEHALAHQVGSEVERAYQRSDLFEKRRGLMNEWGAFVTSDLLPPG